MSRLQQFFTKQSAFLLENHLHAWVAILCLALLPFCDWLSMALVSLIGLRCGAKDGFKAGMVSAAVFVLLFSVSTQNVLAYSALESLVTLGLSFVAAMVLRYTISWNRAISTMLLITLGLTLLTSAVGLDYIHSQAQLLLHVLKEKNSHLMQQFFGQLALDDQKFIAVFLGIKMLSIMLSAVCVLMLARDIQSRLYYPTGFKQELRHFKASRLVIILLLIVMILVFNGQWLWLSCLPLLVTYVLVAGMVTIFRLMPKKHNILNALLIITPLVIAPALMVAIYLLIGSLDGFFNIRLQLHRAVK